MTEQVVELMLLRLATFTKVVMAALFVMSGVLPSVKSFMSMSVALRAMLRVLIYADELKILVFLRESLKLFKVATLAGATTAMRSPFPLFKQADM